MLPTFDRVLGGSLVLIATAAVPPWSAAVALGITPEGLVADWASAPVVHTDPTGDNAGSPIDFGRLWIANDDERLYLRFETGAEIDLQENNDIVLYVDSDNSAATGRSVGGIGAEFSWDFGTRSGLTYTPGGANGTAFDWRDADLRQGPTETAMDFEVTLSRTATVSGTPLFPGSTLRVLLRNEDGGVKDTLPDTGQFVPYTFDATSVPPPPSVSLTRQSQYHVRVMTHNGHNDQVIGNAAETRMLQAIVPDIILFQELYTTSAASAAAYVAGALGGTWHSAENADSVIVSRWPIATTHAIDGNLGARIDLPDATFATDLYVVDAHTPCCANDTGRQAEIDAIMAWVRDLLTPGGAETLPNNTPIVIGGDMNLVGLSQQRRTLLTGDIVDNATHGADFNPDWDATGLTEVYPRHTAGREAHTWHSLTSNYPPGWLDFLGFTDSAATLANHFALWTPAMSPAELAAASLQANDTSDASDHLPFVADFAVKLGAPADLVHFGAE